MEKMKFDMKSVKKVFSYILLLLVIVTGIPALFVYPAERILFQPDSYKTALRKTGIYNQLPNYAAEEARRWVSGNSKGLQANIFSYLKKEDYLEFVNLLIPSDWFQVQVEHLVDQSWGFLNFQSSGLVLDIDLKPLKTHFTSEQSKVIAKKLISILPRCTEEDIVNLASQILSGTFSGIPICRPPDQLQEIAVGLVQVSVQALASQIPEGLNLVKFFPSDSTTDKVFYAFFKQPFDNYHQVRIIWHWMPIISLILLLLLAITLIGSAKELFLLVGSGLMSAGLGGLIIDFILSLQTEGIASRIVQPFSLFIPDIFEVALKESLVSVLEQFILQAGVYTLVCTLLGLGLGIISNFISKRSSSP